MCQQYDKEHESGNMMDWGDMMELSESMRMPGRALELHQKLSSPSRKKSRSESVKRSEERMVKNISFLFFDFSLGKSIFLLLFTQFYLLILIYDENDQ